MNMKNVNIVLWLCVAGMLQASSDRERFSLGDFNQEAWSMDHVRAIHDGQDGRGYSIFGLERVSQHGSDDEGGSEHSFHGLPLPDGDSGVQQPVPVQNTEGLVVVGETLVEPSSGSVVVLLVAPASSELCSMGRRGSLQSMVENPSVQRGASRVAKRPKTPLPRALEIDSLNVSDVLEPGSAREERGSSHHGFTLVKGHGSVSDDLATPDETCPLAGYTFSPVEFTDDQQPVQVVARRLSTVHPSSRKTSHQIGSGSADTSLVKYPSNLTDLFRDSVVSQRLEAPVGNPLVSRQGCDDVLENQNQHVAPLSTIVVARHGQTVQLGVVSEQNDSLEQRPGSANQQQVQEVAAVAAAAHVMTTKTSTQDPMATSDDNKGFCARIAALFSCCGCSR